MVTEFGIEYFVTRSGKYVQPGKRFGMRQTDLSDLLDVARDPGFCKEGEFHFRAKRIQEAKEFPISAERRHRNRIVRGFELEHSSSVMSSPPMPSEAFQNCFLDT